MTFLIGEINMPRVRKVKKSNSKNHMVWRIAVYIRLSKDDGNDESLSVTNQKKIIREYLENFFEEEYILVDIYIDDGISGTTDDARTEFIRMIDDVKAELYYLQDISTNIQKLCRSRLLFGRTFSTL